MLEVSTDTIRPAERMAYWQDAVCSTLLHVDCSGEADFTGRIRQLGTDSITVAELAATPHTAARDQRGLQHDDDDFAIAFLQLEGMMRVTVDEREQYIPPGGLFFYDAHEPNSLNFQTSFRHLFIRAPWKKWGHASDLPRRQSFYAPAATPLLHMASAASLALLDSYAPGRAPTSEYAVAVDVVIHMLSEALSHCADNCDLTPAEKALTMRFRQLLDDRLQDPELTVETIASELGVSSRYLNRVLTRSGESISARILRARLKQCADELRRQPNLRIGDIAWRWGFNDLSYFSRAFKAFHGVSPRDYRLSVQPQ